MPDLLSQYLPLVIFIALAGAISGALLVVPFLVAFQAPDSEKLSAYECGFNAFDDARMKFDVRFYLVSLLFIIFDLEVAFLPLPLGHCLPALASGSIPRSRGRSSRAAISKSRARKARRRSPSRCCR